MEFLKNIGNFFETLKSLAVFLLFVLILCLVGYIYKHHEEIVPSTEDASLQADIIPVSTNISGRVDQVLVGNNTLVQENQILFTLDNTREEIEHKKTLAQAKLDADTYQRYLKAGAAAGILPEKLENVHTAMQVSAANVLRTKYNLDNTTIRA